MSKWTITGKVLDQSLFWKYNGQDKAEAETVTFEHSGSGLNYTFTPNEEAGAAYKRYNWTFEEAEIIKGENGTYALNFYSTSSTYVRSEKPYMSMEVTKEDICTWHKNDVWFREDLHFFVSRSGKKTHGVQSKFSSERCNICGYPADKECKRCKIQIKKLTKGREKSRFLKAAFDYYVSQGAEVTESFVIWPPNWEEGMQPLSKVEGSKENV